MRGWYAIKQSKPQTCIIIIFKKNFFKPNLGDVIAFDFNYTFK